MNSPFGLNKQDRYVIVVGSISESRIVEDLVYYAVYDNENFTIEMKALVPKNYV
jgi:hypothetical protein